MKGIARVFALLRKNRAFVCLFAAGVVLRLFVWLAYQPAILVLADSYFYLRGATLGTGLGSARPFLYSLFLRPLLALDGLATVTALQHVLGLAVAAGLYAFQRRLNVPRVLAAIGTSLVLLDGYQLNLEQQILTESLFETFVVGGLVTLLWFEKAPAWVYVVGGALLGLSAITRFIGLSLFLVVPIFLVGSRVGWVRLCAAVTGCLAPLLLYATLFEGNSSRPAGLKAQVAVRLYGKVAGFADCSRVVLPSTERQLCIGKPPSKRRDYFSVWQETPVDRMRVPAGTDKEDVVMSFTRRFILLQPLDFATAVARDFLKFFSWSSVQDLARAPVRRWEFFDSRTQAFRSPGVGTDRRFRQTMGSSPSEFGLDERFRLDGGIAGKLRAYQRIVYARGPLLGFLALLGLLGALLGRELPDGRRGARLSCLLFTLSGLALYLFPALFVTFRFRYVISALPLLGPAGAIGASLLLVRLGRARARDGA